MYHGDERHSGNAAGQSAITSASVHRLVSLHKLVLNDPIISVPAIVQGKIYVGTKSPKSGGTPYKIDVASGGVNGTFFVPFSCGGGCGSGVGATPAAVEGKGFFFSLGVQNYS